MPERDEAQHRADLAWLYGAEPTPDERTQVMNEAELAELGKRSARVASSARSGASFPGDTAPAAPSYPATPPVPTAAPRPAARVAAPPVPPGATPPARTTRRPRRPRRPARTAKRLLIALVAIVIAWMAWLVGVPAYAWSTMPQVDAFPTSGRPAAQPGTAILMVGSDGRSDLTAAQRQELGTGMDSGQRTDTIMILFIPKKGEPILLSLPRDSYVAIPGYGHNKINAAFSFGGPKLLIQTIEQDTGLRMDGYLEIGMGGFANVVDAIGGIHLCLPAAIHDQDSNTNLNAGCQTLNGPQALGYVRMRHADPLGDIGRVKRQRQMMTAIAKKVASPRFVLDPMNYWKFNMAVRDALTRDGLGLTSLPSVGAGMLAIARGKGLQLTVPISNMNAVTPAGSSVLWDTTAAQQMFGQMAQGSTEGFAKYAK